MRPNPGRGSSGCITAGDVSAAQASRFVFHPEAQATYSPSTGALYRKNRLCQLHGAFCERLRHSRGDDLGISAQDATHRYHAKTRCGGVPLCALWRVSKISTNSL